MTQYKMRAVDINNLDKPQEKEVTETKETVEKEQETQETQETKIENNESKEKELQSEVQNEGQEQKQEVQEEVEKVQLKDEDVLKYIKEKGIEVNSFEDLKKPKQETEIPEEVKSFLDYKKETGRSYQDYLELQKDWKSENEDTVLKRYLKDKNPYFTDEDIKDELSELGFDEDVDDEADIRKKKREKRRLLSEALNYLEGQKEKYKQPTERFSETKADVEIPEDFKQAKERLSQIEKSQKKQEKLLEERHEKFLNETKSFLNEEFKGFEFDINGEKKLFKNGDTNEIFKTQSDISNVLNKFVDNETREIKDMKAYHKALHAFANADAFAKHFYELGKSETIKNEAKESKNINFSGHKSLDSFKPKTKGKMRVVNPADNRVKVRY